MRYLKLYEAFMSELTYRPGWSWENPNPGPPDWNYRPDTECESLNFFLLSWTIKSFIKEENLQAKIDSEEMFLYTEIDNYFKYSEWPKNDGGQLKIFCQEMLFSFMCQKKIIETQNIENQLKNFIIKCVYVVIKKMYEDEKNKTI